MAAVVSFPGGSRIAPVGGNMTGFGFGFNVTSRRVAPKTPDFYVDSVNGSDANSGTTLAAAWQTLGKAQTATAGQPGKTLALARGSYWREQFNVLSDNIRIVAVGSGAMPVIDGADIVTTGWTQPDAATYPNVWSRSWTRASATTTSSEYLGYWEAGVRTTNRATLAALQAGGNGDWYTTSLTTQTATVSIRAAADPNSDGVLREITKRHYGINAHSTTLAVTRAGFYIDGPIEIKRCVGHYNALAGNGTGRSLFLRDGNIHHVVTEGELLEDILVTEVSPETALAAGAAPITHYRANAGGFNPVSRRCIVLLPGGAARASALNGAFTTHGSSPAVSDSYLIEQAIVRGAAMGGGGTINTVRDTYVEDWNAPCIETGSSIRTLERIMMRDTTVTPYANGSPCLRRLTSSGTYTASHLALQNAKGASVIGSSGGTQPTHANCSFFHSGTGGGFSAGAPGVNNCVIWANGRVYDAMLTGYVGDFNVFYSSAGVTGPLFNYNSVNYLNPPTSLGLFQTASGQDTNSVYLKSADQVSGNGIAFWLGVSSGANAGPVGGDWRINPSAKVYKADGSALTGLFADGMTPITAAGPQFHWDFNARAAVAGPPSRYPVLPATIAEMRTYLEDPAAWNFYP